MILKFNEYPSSVFPEHSYRLSTYSQPQVTGLLVNKLRNRLFSSVVDHVIFSSPGL